MKKTAILATTVAAVLGLPMLYPSVADAQMSNIINAGDTVLGPNVDQSKVLTAEEAKALGSQEIGTTTGVSLVRPTGPYAEIDTTRSMTLMRELLGPTGPETKKDIAEIKKHPGSYIPPVIVSVAVAEFNDGDVQDAVFWLHAGLLRAILDAKLSSDRSVGDAPRFLLLQTPRPLRQAALGDPATKAKLASAAAAWDAKTPMAYDHRWIALHGIDATLSALQPENASGPLTIPEAQWRMAAEKNRTDYVNQMSTPQPAPPPPSR